MTPRTIAEPILPAPITPIFSFNIQYLLRRSVWLVAYGI
jgi:hypothetical protein